MSKTDTSLWFHAVCDEVISEGIRLPKPDESPAAVVQRLIKHHREEAVAEYQAAYGHGVKGRLELSPEVSLLLSLEIPVDTLDTSYLERSPQSGILPAIQAALDNMTRDRGWKLKSIDFT